MDNRNLTRHQPLAAVVDRAVRRSVKRRGTPRGEAGCRRLHRDVLRAVPGADVGLALTSWADLIVYVDGEDLRRLLARERLPEEGSEEERRVLAAARADLCACRARAVRVRLAWRPVRCARARESRPRATPRRSPRSPRGPPDDSDPEPPPPPAGLASPSPRFGRPWRRVDDALRERLGRLPRLVVAT